MMSVVFVIFIKIVPKKGRPIGGKNCYEKMQIHILDISRFTTYIM